MINDNKPIRSSTHELAELLTQHVRRMKILTQRSIFELNGFSHTLHACKTLLCGLR